MSAIDDTDLKLLFAKEKKIPTHNDSKTDSIAETAARRLIPGMTTDPLPTPRIADPKPPTKKEEAIINIWHQKNTDRRCDNILGFTSEERQHKENK